VKLAGLSVKNAEDHGHEPAIIFAGAEAAIKLGSDTGRGRRTLPRLPERLMSAPAGMNCLHSAPSNDMGRLNREERCGHAVAADVQDVGDEIAVVDEVKADGVAGQFVGGDVFPGACRTRWVTMFFCGKCRLLDPRGGEQAVANSLIGAA